MSVFNLSKCYLFFIFLLTFSVTINTSRRYEFKLLCTQTHRTPSLTERKKKGLYRGTNVESFNVCMTF